MYNSTLFRVLALSIIISIFVPACGTGPAPATQPPNCTGIVLPLPATQPPEAVKPETGKPPEPLPFAGQPPAESILPEDKPALIMSVKDPAQVPPQMDTSHIIGFIFPGGQIAIKAATMKNPYDAGDGCAIGVVEIGEGVLSLPKGIYTVTIDLKNPESVVNGSLKSFPENPSEAPIPVTFTRVPLVRNEEARPNSDSFPPLGAIITPNSVCFVVGLADSGEVSQNPSSTVYWARYCSNEPILSVHENFPEQFANMQKDLQDSIDHLTQTYPNLTLENLELESTISEMEDPEDIGKCNANQQSPETCNPDITGTASQLFWSGFDNAKAASNGGDFAVTAGVVKVWSDLTFKGGSVPPGDYWVMFWFHNDESFMGATLLGVTTEEVKVEGQTIPATPSYFLDADNNRRIVSWISAWHLGNWCICWQSNCP
jgi:hypothetical protein